MDTTMKTIDTRNKEITLIQKERRHVLWSGLAFVCLSWGALAPLAGVIFFIIHTILKEDTLFGNVGTGLMIASIPLLLAGSHFLDVWDRHRKLSNRSDRENNS